MVKKEKSPALSERLTAVAGLVTKGNRVCDVGCDHGFVPIYLVMEGISQGVLAMDVGKGPLAAAKEHIGEYGLEEQIQTRLSDGLALYENGEAQTLIIAGMGGPLMLRILEAYPEKTADFEELILQPQSEVGAFRKSLRLLGYEIVDEKMILEDGKFYPMMRFIKGKAAPEEETINELEDCYGPILLGRKDPVLKQYLLREKRIIDEILEQAKVEKWEKQKELNRQALSVFE